MDPGKSERRAYQCSPRRKRIRAYKGDRKSRRGQQLNVQYVSEWRSSCLGYTRRYL